jgi:murein DD-endopeptidase MepM/ murein hydrolase activator NlpD
MIGLAISMGATSLLVTRQSDQAQAAAPVGSQKAASTTPAVPETEVKFAAINLESPQHPVSTVDMMGNPVVLASPTSVSQVPGLEAKWQIAANNKTQLPAAISIAKVADKNSIYLQPQSAQGLTRYAVPTVDTAIHSFATAQNFAPSESVVISQAAPTPVPASDVNAQLKAQQEFAIGRLQEKSNRLRKSLTELRSEQRQGFPGNTASAVTNQSNLISNLKDQESVAIQQLPSPASATPVAAQSALETTYQVKSGDTLAAIAGYYGTSVSELVKANNLKNPNQLRISQKLVIPTKAEHKTFNHANIDLQANAVESRVVAVYPVNNASVRNYLPTVSQPSTDIHNSVTVPTTVAINNQPYVPVTPENTSDAVNSYGVGGDSPVPRAFSEMQLAQRPTQKIARATGTMRLRSLKAEIERLRQKYRAQQAGVVIPTVSQSGGEIAASQQEYDNFPLSNPMQLNAVQIHVPHPALPGYKQPVFHPIRPLSEPINPEFLPNKPISGRKNSPSSKVSFAPIEFNAASSLGKLRGTTVSPQLPPLAAVDQYLPRSVEPQNTYTPFSGSVAYIWPAKGVLTSGYGWRWGKMHRGIDIANSTGTPIYASAPGVIERAGWNNGGYGNVVDIRHADGSMTRYGHNSRILVQAGQQVQQGQQIAAMGSTGFSTGPHSHFEVHPSGKAAVNPIAFLPNRL